MLKSMTGFGKATCQLHNKQVVIEIRTLNGKTLDVSLKLPPVYKAFEQDLRQMLAQQLIRGKIELYIGSEHGQGMPELSINKELLETYFNELRELSDKLGVEAGSDLLSALLRLPDVQNQAAAVSGTEDWEQIKPAIQQAIDQTDVFRTTEGKNLEDDLRARISNLGRLLDQLEPLEATRKENLKNKLTKGLQELSENNQPDPNRFEQELIYYLEKLDISEEKVRLVSHLGYFEETLDETESSGKKLGFITQEIGREINTIGSKANDANIQKIVVQMKDELEKIKEQLMNIL